MSEQANHPKLAGADDGVLHIWWTYLKKTYTHFELSVVLMRRMRLFDTA
jgi:hypothetical protein